MFCGGCLCKMHIYRLMWLIVDISVKKTNKHRIAHFNVGVEYGRIVGLCATSMVLTDSSSSLLIRRRKMKQHTRRSATNPTIHRKQRPTSQWRMAPISPCLQWRPRSVDSGSSSPSPGLWTSAEGAAHGCNVTTVGGIHTVCSFSLIPRWWWGRGVGGGGWWGRIGIEGGTQAKYLHCSACWALLMTFCLPPTCFTCWAWPSLPAPTTTQTPLASFSVHPQTGRDSGQGPARTSLLFPEFFWVDAATVAYRYLNCGGWDILPPNVAQRGCYLSGRSPEPQWASFKSYSCAFLSDSVAWERNLKQTDLKQNKTKKH